MSYDANYNGLVVAETIYDDNGNILFVFRYIDTNQNRNAVSLHANGNVGDGSGPTHKVSAIVVANPGWTQTTIQISLK